MQGLIDFISQPWPWYVAGPLIGLVIPLLLFVGNKRFGVSSTFRHCCAATLPANIEYHKYDWKRETWNLSLVVGIALGAFVAATFFANPDTVAFSTSTANDLRALGIEDQSGLVPPAIFCWHGLATLPGFIMIVGGGFLVGFGARYADGCTSGHGIMGLANLEWPSLVAIIAFFAGGIFVTYLVLPLILKGAP